MDNTKTGDKFYSHFTNSKCEYFPCHKVKDSRSFNCLFCYCPLYALGEECGGNFVYTPAGIKDCGGCLVPHEKGGYEYIAERVSLVTALTKKKN